MKHIHAKYAALQNFLGKEAADSYINSLSEQEKIAINFGAIAQGAKNFVAPLAQRASAAITPLAQRASAAVAPLAQRASTAVSQGFNKLRGAVPAMTPPASSIPKPPINMANVAKPSPATLGNIVNKDKPGGFDKWMGRAGTAMTVAGAGQAFMGAADPQREVVGSDQSYLPKLALFAGLEMAKKAMKPQDMVDLAAYGLLSAGPAAEIIAPHWAEEHKTPLLGADLAGLGLLARHHIPGLKPAGH